MSAGHPVRRIGVIVLALAIATILLRAQVSSALVARGDALALFNRPRDARAIYARALMFDPGNSSAADRLAFAAAMGNDVPLLTSCIAIAGAVISRDPENGPLLMDRALCYQRLRRYALAIDDFRRVGRLLHDPRALMFAALDEGRLDNRRTSRQLLLEALAYDRRFMPAAAALARLAR